MKTILKITTITALFFSIISCEKTEDAKPEAPSVMNETTADNVEVSYTTIKISGKVTSDDENEITARGVCWSSSPGPTISGDKTTEISDVFTSTINNLVPNTMYYFRTYATNSVGTSYGEEQSFSTSSLDNTTWDFLLIHDENTSWHADVAFNADGTTIYDEPDAPGVYLAYGTWSLSGNELTYDMDSSDPDDPNYILIGNLSQNDMGGTYLWGNYTKTWNAVPK